MPQLTPEAIELCRLALGAVKDHQAWQGFVNQFYKTFQASSTSLLLWQNDGALGRASFVCGMTPADIQEWHTRWVDDDPWMKGQDLSSLPTGVVIPNEFFCPEDKLMSLPIYEQFLLPRRMHYGGGVNYHMGTAVSAIHTFLRPREVGPISDAERDLWHSIVPTVQDAVTLSIEAQRLRDENTILSSSLESAGTGLIFLNASGEIIKLNSIAERLILDSPYLHTEGKTLTLANRDQQREFLAALRSSALPWDTWKKFLVCRDLSTSADALLLLLTRVTAPRPTLLGPDTPVMLALLIDPRQPFPVNTEALQALFDLTPAEARFAERLTAGLSVADICTELQITDNTARTHLKRIFSKTSTTRQSELISLILRIGMRSLT